MDENKIVELIRRKKEVLATIETDSENTIRCYVLIEDKPQKFRWFSLDDGYSATSHGKTAFDALLEMVSDHIKSIIVIQKGLSFNADVRLRSDYSSRKAPDGLVDY